MNKLIIIGASGHGKVILDIAILCGYTDIVFADDNTDIKDCCGYPVVNNSKCAPDGEVFIAIGDAVKRRYLTEYYRNRKKPILIHPSSVIAKDVTIGEGTVIMAGAVLNPGVRLGKSCIINTSSSVDHDCEIGNFGHVSVGTHVCGTVKIGDNVWMGAGSVISNNISICSNVLIGAGTVVVKNIDCEGTYIGCPAKAMSKVTEG